LLEGLVFGNRVADDINKTIIKNRTFKKGGFCSQAELKIENHKDIEKIKEENRRLVIDEILKVREDLKDELSVN
jgi:L-aspartate oxidase